MKKKLYFSQKCLAALTGPRTYVKLVRVLLRAANHFYRKYIMNTGNCKIER